MIDRSLEQRESSSWWDRIGFEGTSPKLFWPETLVYLLPGAELNQMLTAVVAIKSETACEPELLLFAGMIDHLIQRDYLST